MSLLRNDGDNSINFQRASCTLDGCVKIWTSRVDSVGTETGKLLSNLANEGRIGVDDDDDEDGDGEGGDPSQPKKRKTHRPASTLAKDASQLRNKKLDLEFTVDPLFRKTCADFDEGGAQGLLMNHLSLGVGSDGSLRVVFDAGDSRGRDTEEEEPDMEEPPAEVDLSHLRRMSDFTFRASLDLTSHRAIPAGLGGVREQDDLWRDQRLLFLQGLLGIRRRDHSFPRRPRPRPRRWRRRGQRAPGLQRRLRRRTHGRRRRRTRRRLLRRRPGRQRRLHAPRRCKPKYGWL